MKPAPTEPDTAPDPAPYCAPHTAPDNAPHTAPCIAAAPGRRRALRALAWPVAAAGAAAAPAVHGSMAPAAGDAGVPAMAWGERPALSPDFAHFPYVRPDAPAAGSVVLDGFGSFDKLNPFTLRGIAAAGLNTLMFETLGEPGLDEPFTVYPLLARRFDFAADRLSIRFLLDPRARFSDGSPVQAHDVAHSFAMLTGAQAHPRHAQVFADVARVDVLDDLTVRFVFRKPNHELHMVLASALPVFSRRWGGGRPFDRIDRDEPLASGPYRIDGGIDAIAWGRAIAYVRRPDYWAADLPVRRGMFRFARVTYQYFRDETARLEAFKAGEFDWLLENVAKNWARGHTGRRYDSGELVKQRFAQHNAVGMQGFAMNLRRPLFRDVRVRRALGLAFDFEWMNAQLFYGEYVRTHSYFENTPMKADGLPGADELELLEPWRDRLDPAVFGPAVEPPATVPPATLRQNLREALRLLAEAGWQVGDDGLLRDAAGQPFAFEVLSYAATLERVAAPWVRNLARIGVQARLRTTDPALYQQRLDQFDFDVTTTTFPQSLTPGNEQWMMFGSAAAGQPGSDNLPGIRDEAVDALIARLVGCDTRAQLQTAARALDRVLRAGHYVVPHYHVADFRIAHDRRLSPPPVLPRYYAAEPWLLKTWWRS